MNQDKNKHLTLVIAINLPTNNTKLIIFVPNLILSIF